MVIEVCKSHFILAKFKINAVSYRGQQVINVDVILSEFILQSYDLYNELCNFTEIPSNENDSDK